MYYLKKSQYLEEFCDSGMYVFLFLIWNVTAQVCESVNLYYYVVDYNFTSYWFL
jgi:hypothetical protein